MCCITVILVTHDDVWYMSSFLFFMLNTVDIYLHCLFPFTVQIVLPAMSEVELLPTLAVAHTVVATPASYVSILI